MKRSHPIWPRRSSKRPRRAKRSDDPAFGLLALTAAVVGAGWFLARVARLAAGARSRQGSVRSEAPVRTPDIPRRRVTVFSGAAGRAQPEESLTPEALVYEHFTQGMALLQSGNPAQAAVRLEKARAGAPGKASVHEALGRAYFELGRLKEAEREFRSVVDTAPTNDYAHFALARVLERTGRFDEAGTHRRLAQAMRPDEERYRR